MIAFGVQWFRAVQVTRPRLQRDSLRIYHLMKYPHLPTTDLKASVSPAFSALEPLDTREQLILPIKRGCTSYQTSHLGT